MMYSYYKLISIVSLNGQPTKNMQLHQYKFEFIQHNVPNTNKKLLLELPFVAYEQSYTTQSKTVLAALSEIRDLGVLITPEISWSNHIRSIAKKVTKAASWCLSVFRYRDHRTMITLFKSLIRSHLEYCCPI